MRLVIRRIVTAWLTALIFTVVSLFPIASVQAAQDLFKDACSSASDSAVCQSKDEGKTKEKAANQIQGIINLLLYALGILAVIMIIFGGFRYVLANGDAGAVKQGKDTVLYAVIGLIVALLSYAIVNFVVFRFTNTGSNTSS